MSSPEKAVAFDAMSRIEGETKAQVKQRHKAEMKEMKTTIDRLQKQKRSGDEKKQLKEQIAKMKEDLATRHIEELKAVSDREAMEEAEGEAQVVAAATSAPAQAASDATSATSQPDSKTSKKKKGRKNNLLVVSSNDEDEGTDALPASSTASDVPMDDPDDGWTTVEKAQGKSTSEDDQSSTIQSGSSLGMAGSCDHEGPIHIARLEMVASLLRSAKATRVLDAGCGEGHLLTRLRDQCPLIRQVVGVDVDQAALLRASQRVEDCTSGGTVPAPRGSSMGVQLYHGSVSVGSEVPEQFRNQYFDAALVIETVEHLDPQPLANLPNVLFGVIKPTLVVVTTPNADYNCVFNFTPGQMRHWDHRFEWTRQEFSEWADHIARTYGYKVEFGGVGDPPASHPDVGFCSQFAIFHVLDASDDKTPTPTSTSKQWVKQYSVDVTEMAGTSKTTNTQKAKSKKKKK